MPRSYLNAFNVDVPNVAPLSQAIAQIPDQMRANQKMNLLEQQNIRAAESHTRSIEAADRDTQIKAMEWLGQAALVAGDDPTKLAMLKERASEQFGVPIDDDDVEAARMHMAGGVAAKRSTSGSGVYGTPIYTQDAEGNIGLGAMTKGGAFKSIDLPEGTNVAPGVKKVDLGSHWGFVDRTGQVIRQVKKDIAGAEQERAEGKARGEAKIALPQAEATANEMLTSIDGLLDDKALDSSLGWNTWKQHVPNSPQFRVGTKIEQLRGQAFLQAFEKLKGGGPITDTEGEKGTQAIARLQSAQNAKDFREALNDLKRVVKSVRDRARKKAGVTRDTGQIQHPNAPEVGTVADGYMYMGGNPADPRSWQRATR